MESEKTAGGRSDKAAKCSLEASKTSLEGLKKAVRSSQKHSGGKEEWADTI